MHITYSTLDAIISSSPYSCFCSVFSFHKLVKYDFSWVLVAKGSSSKICNISQDLIQRTYLRSYEEYYLLINSLVAQCLPGLMVVFKFLSWDLSIITLWYWQAPSPWRFMMFSLLIMAPKEQSHFSYTPSAEVTGAIRSRL